MASYTPLDHDYSEKGKDNHEVSGILFAINKVGHADDEVIAQSLERLSSQHTQDRRSREHLPGRWSDIKASTRVTTT